MTQVAFWDVEDATSLPPVRAMTVAPVSAEDARSFCGRYHYTGMGENLNQRHGLWDDLMLLGIIGYNIPTREAAACVFGDEHQQHVWHMSRLALADSAPRNSESRLIGGSLRFLQREHPDVWAILTYAATDAGHIGTVYQATNAIYTGEAGLRHTKYYVDEEGSRRGSYQNGRYIGPQRALDMGWTVTQGGVKHRYVYLLGSKSERKSRKRMLLLPSLPYPKKTPSQ